MDRRGNIYEGTDEHPVATEDAARLDGYLRARAEIDHLKKLEALQRERDEMLSDANAARPLDADG